MEDSVNERLRFLLRLLKTSQKDFAKRVDMTPQGLNKILKAESKPSFNFLVKLLRVDPRINANWVIIGAGTPFIDPELHTLSTGVDILQEPQAPYGNENVPTTGELKIKLEACEGLVQILKEQLDDKDEIIQLLKAQ